MTPQTKSNERPQRPLRRADTSSDRRQRGSATLLLLTMSFVLFLVATYSLSLGQGFIARNQLQIIADSAARAAVAVVRDGGFELSGRDIASTIALRTTAIEPGIFLVNDDVIFGDYDFDSETFTPGGDEKAPAVQVFARRTASSFNGPLEMAVSLFYGEQDLELTAMSIATFGCREIVIAIDTSLGMEEEFDAALQLARDIKRELEQAPRSGDKIGLTFYAADGATLGEYASGGGAFWAGGAPSYLSLLSDSGAEIDAGLTAFGLEGECESFRDTLPGGGRGSCAGKGDQWGIDQSLELFDQMGIDACSVSRERLIVLITSGMPCAVFGPAVGDFATPYYGGTRADAVAAAERADALGVSIAPVRIDRGDPAEGDYCRNIPLAFRSPGQPNGYLNSLARGFVERALSEPTESDLEDLIGEMNNNLTVRIVQ